MLASLAKASRQNLRSQNLSAVRKSRMLQLTPAGFDLRPKFPTCDRTRLRQAVATEIVSAKGERTSTNQRFYNVGFCWDGDVYLWSSLVTARTSTLDLGPQRGASDLRGLERGRSVARVPFLCVSVGTTTWESQTDCLHRTRSGRQPPNDHRHLKLSVRRR